MILITNKLNKVCITKKFGHFNYWMYLCVRNLNIIASNLNITEL